mgnify:CR=1 FL=1
MCLAMLNHDHGRCGNCGTVWSRVCLDCGYPLAPEQNTCPECGVAWVESSTRIRIVTSSRVASVALLSYGGLVVYMGYAWGHLLFAGPRTSLWVAGLYAAFALSGVAATAAYVGSVWHTPWRWTVFFTAMLIFVGSYAFTFVFSLTLAMMLSVLFGILAHMILY